MQRKMRIVIAACLSLVVAACGQGESMEELATPAAMEQVEQGIGTTPYCPSTQTTTGYIQDRTDWAATCGGCTTSGRIGRKGTHYQRCCIQDNVNGGTTCGSWKLIQNLCSSCELEP